MKVYTCDQKKALAILDAIYLEACKKGARIARKYERDILTKNRRTYTLDAKAVRRIMKSMASIRASMNDIARCLGHTKHVDFARALYLLQPTDSFDPAGSEEVFDLENLKPGGTRLPKFLDYAKTMPEHREKFIKILKHAVCDVDAERRKYVNDELQKWGWEPVAEYESLFAVTNEAIAKNMPLKQYFDFLVLYGYEQALHFDYLDWLVNVSDFDLATQIFNYRQSLFFGVGVDLDEKSRPLVNKIIGEYFAAARTDDGNYVFKDYDLYRKVTTLIEMFEADFDAELARTIEPVRPNCQPPGLEAITRRFNVLKQEKLVLKDEVYFTDLKPDVCSYILGGHHAVTFSEFKRLCEEPDAVPGNIPVLVSGGYFVVGCDLKELLAMGSKLDRPVIFTGFVAQTSMNYITYDQLDVLVREPDSSESPRDLHSNSHPQFFGRWMPFLYAERGPGRGIH